MASLVEIVGKLSLSLSVSFSRVHLLELTGWERKMDGVNSLKLILHFKINLTYYKDFKIVY